MYRKTKPECGACLKLKARKGRKPDCIKCGWEPTLPGNYETMSMILQYSFLFTDSWGGINLDGIKTVIEFEDVDEPYVVFRKLIVFMKQAVLINQED